MISKLSQNIQPSSTLEITAKANQLKAEGIDVIGFGAGEPDFITPIEIREAAKNAIDNGFTKYTPASGLMSLRQIIANKLKKENNLEYNANQIVVSNGAKHSLINAFSAILDLGDEVIIPAPFWLSYPEMVKIVHGVPKYVYTKKENRFKLQPSEFKKAISNKTKAIVLNSPSNPTGVIYTAEELKALGDIAVENNIWIISDEIYEYLVYENNEHISMASLSKEIYDHTITINGISKAYAMTGWRIGYLAAPLEVAKAAGNIQSHATSNPNSIAQKASEFAIEHGGNFIKEMVQTFSKRRDCLYEGLKQIEGFEVVKPDGAFYCFVDIKELYWKKYKDQTINSASIFAKLLLEDYSVAVVPCKDFEAPSCIRLSYTINEESITKGLNRIQEFINELV
ncbi:aspartate aminotransferase [Candidatus Epulonipiscium fishelsonii]|nr:aspartate aminotransferase [Epulopiscium sp. SCG-C06WGA-EpuloA1]